MKKLLVMVCTLAVAAAAPTLGGPITVSPGGPEGFVPVDRACPTFSWGADAGARSFELVVFELPEQMSAFSSDGLQAVMEQVDPVIQVRLPGTSRSWTPSVTDALTPGGRFAWFVRAEEKGGMGDWSAGALFEVGAEPTVDEVRDALAVLERFLVAHGEAGKETAGTSEQLLAGIEPLALLSPGTDAARTPLEPQPSVALTPDAIGLRSQSTVTTGKVFGVHGITNSNGVESAGVVGEALVQSPVGGTYGVFGRNDSITDNSAGVFGQASALGGKVYGVYGATSSITSGSAGVYGASFGTLNAPYGVHGKAIANSGRGVFGEVTATGGTNYGVYGKIVSSNGRGVYGLADKSTGSNFGVYGISNSTTGTGVFGKADAASGSNKGVWAVTDSSEGVALYADNTGGGADLILAGSIGKLYSDPDSSTSELVFYSNDGLDLRLDNGGSASSPAFSVKFNGSEKLRVEAGGQTLVDWLRLRLFVSGPSCNNGVIYYDANGLGAVCACVNSTWWKMAGGGSCPS